MSGIPSWCVVGAKVVCVSVCAPPGIIYGPDAVVGETYTISRVGREFGSATGRVIIALAELPIFHPAFGELGFWVGDFRPVVTRTPDQDVALFAPLLDHLPEHEPA